MGLSTFWLAVHLSCAAISSMVCVVSAQAIEADSLPMPLLTKWQRVLEKNTMPKSKAPLRPLSPQITPLINWKFLSPHLVNNLSAQFYDDKKAAFIEIDYFRNSRDDGEAQLYHWRKDALEPKKWNYAKDGWLTFIGSLSLPLAVGGRATSPDAWLMNRHPKGTLYRLDAKSERIARFPLTDAEQQLLKPFQPTVMLNVVFNEKTKSNVVYNLFSGQPLATIHRPFGWFHARLFNGNLIVAGRNALREGEPFLQELLWHKSFDNGNSWQTTKLRVDDKYLRALLPNELSGLHVEEDQDNSRVNVLNNGDIIFTLSATQRQAHENLSCVFLIRQPLKGTPQILTWKVHHSLEANASITDDSWKARSNHASVRTFDHAWFVGQDGQILSGYVWWNEHNDFFFDVDTQNQMVTYILGGQLWALDLSKENINEASEK